MRAYLLFFVAAAFDPDGAPTFDPEEAETTLLDEYSPEDAVAPARFLQNYTGNITEPVGTATPTEIPWVPLAVVGGGCALVAAFFLLRPAYTYETVSYDHAANSGLLDHPDYDIHADDGSDYDYDEEYE